MTLQNFLKYPSQPVEFRESKIKIFAISLLTCFFLVFLTSFLSTAVKNMMFDGLENKIFSSPLLESPSGTVTLFLAALILGPFLEELIFRLPMNGQKNTASFSLAVFVCLMIQPRLSTISLLDWPRIIVGILSGIVMYFLMSRYLFEQLSKLLKRYSRDHLIYFLTTIFAFFHVANFGGLQWEYILLYPILVLPQFVMGGYLAFIRINLGFWYSFVFHAFINVPASLVILSHIR